MAYHPINLAVRFLLEMCALGAMGVWGWHQGAGPMRFVLAIGIPLLAMVLWGTFAVPDDPSRSGEAPVPVPGSLRLVLELAFFAFAIWMLLSRGYMVLGWGFGIVVIVHYVISYDRIAWLLKQ